MVRNVSLFLRTVRMRTERNVYFAVASRALARNVNLCQSNCREGSQTIGLYRSLLSRYIILYYYIIMTCEFLKFKLLLLVIPNGLKLNFTEAPGS